MFLSWEHSSDICIFGVSLSLPLVSAWRLISVTVVQILFLKSSYGINFGRLRLICNVAWKRYQWHYTVSALPNLSLFFCQSVCLFSVTFLRQEKKENDRILQEQIDQYREEASSLRLDNAKVAAKVSRVYLSYLSLHMQPIFPCASAVLVWFLWLCYIVRLVLK